MRTLLPILLQKPAHGLTLMSGPAGIVSRERGQRVKTPTGDNSFLLGVARGDGSFGRLLVKLAKINLLAIDDWLIVPLAEVQRTICSRSSRTATSERQR